MTDVLSFEDEQNTKCAELMEKRLDESYVRRMDEAFSQQFPRPEQKAPIRIVHMAPKRHMEKVA